MFKCRWCIEDAKKKLVTFFIKSNYIWKNKNPQIKTGEGPLLIVNKKIYN